MKGGRCGLDRVDGCRVFRNNWRFVAHRIFCNNGSNMVIITYEVEKKDGQWTTKRTTKTEIYKNASDVWDDMLQKSMDDDIENLVIQNVWQL